MFDGSGATAPQAKSTCGPFWVMKGPKPLKKFIEILPVVVSDQSKAQAKGIQSYIRKMPKAFSWNTYFMSNLYLEMCQLTGKSMKDQPSTFAIFDWPSKNIGCTPSTNPKKPFTYASSRTNFRPLSQTDLCKSDFKIDHISRFCFIFLSNPSNLVGKVLLCGRSLPQLHFMNNFSRTRFQRLLFGKEAPKFLVSNVLIQG